MIHYNRFMDKFINIQSELDKNNLTNFCRNTVEKIKIVNNYILFDEEEINFEWCMKIFNDCTGVEMNFNEVEIPLDILDKYNILDIFNSIKELIIKNINNLTLCLIITIGDVALLRFHKYRKDEGFWLSEDIEIYNEAVLYEIIDIFN